MAFYAKNDCIFSCLAHHNGLNNDSLLARLLVMNT